MKLYTEQQVRFIIGRAQILGLDDDFLFNEDYLIEQAESIELPSDEEIGKEFKHSSENWEVRQALEEGAKWMRDKIQGGKK